MPFKVGDLVHINHQIVTSADIQYHTAIIACEAPEWYPKTQVFIIQGKTNYCCNLTIPGYDKGVFGSWVETRLLTPVIYLRKELK